LQLAGILIAGAYTAKETGREKKQARCASFKNGCIGEAHLLRHWDGRFSS
jgi:hypothetical protein